eukprot:1161320-Pelagomonas_calceolata.AAC.9
MKKGAPSPALARVPSETAATLKANARSHEKGTHANVPLCNTPSSIEEKEAHWPKAQSACHIKPAPQDSSRLTKCTRPKGVLHRLRVAKC